jgi:rubrerythrin
MAAQVAAARPVARLQSLARHGRQADERARGLGMTSWSDDLSHLSSEKRASWQRVLSSIATTEGIEATVMDPLLVAKRADAEVLDYLEVHAADERRHHELLAGYLKNTFGYEKKSRTLSDRIFYERLLPAMSQTFRYKPLYGFALLYCYERFAMAFYVPLRTKAQTDGAQNLLSLLQSIEKDELRHVAGMEHLLKEEIRAQGGLRLGDLKAVRAMLSLMLVDINMSSWAFHNRDIRAHLQELDISPDEVTQTGRRMRDATLELMTVTDEGVRNVASR